LNRSLHGTLLDGDNFATVASAIAAIAAVMTAVATVPTVATVAAMAAITTVAALAAARAVVLHGAAIVSMAAAMLAAMASATVRAAVAAAAGEQAGFGIPLTTHQGDSNQGEEDRHTKHNDTVHSQILQCASRYQKVKPLTSPSTVPHPTADGPAEWMQSQVHLARQFPAERQAPWQDLPIAKDVSIAKVRPSQYQHGNCCQAATVKMHNLRASGAVGYMHHSAK
jgi:hypothetical protein